MKNVLMAAMLISALSMKPAKTERILFFGDSITQMGTNKGGYINLLNEALVHKGVAAQYNITGSGVGYNKVYDLYLRMDEDVMVKNPDRVFIWIGVNDVGHKLWMGTGTDADKFERFYEAIIKKMQAKNIQLVLCTPALIGERKDCTNPQDGDLNYYAQIIRNLAIKYHCSLVDFRSIFQSYEQEHNLNNLPKGILTIDGIHLNESGNRLVADEVWKAITQ